MAKPRKTDALRSQNNAKLRRDRENAALWELSRCLPLPKKAAESLDKSSVIRLACVCLRLRDFFPEGLGPLCGGVEATINQDIKELGTLHNLALDGFLLTVGVDGKILYVSEAASSHLGLPQLELIGKSVYEFTPESDHKEVKDLLSSRPPVTELDQRRVIKIPIKFTLRLKCILPKKQAELTVDGYKVIHCMGHLRLNRKVVFCNSERRWKTSYETLGVVATGQSLPPSSFTDIKMNSTDFAFKTGLDLKFLYVEPRMVELIGVEPTYLLNMSLYNFVKPASAEDIRKAHYQVLLKNQATTSYYTFLTPGGGGVELQSFLFFLTTSSKGKVNRFILFLNVIISIKSANPNDIVDEVQLYEPKTNIKSAQSKKPRLPKSKIKNAAGGNQEDKEATNMQFLVSHAHEKRESLLHAPHNFDLVSSSTALSACNSRTHIKHRNLLGESHQNLAKLMHKESNQPSASWASDGSLQRRPTFKCPSRILQPVENLKINNSIELNSNNNMLGFESSFNMTCYVRSSSEPHFPVNIELLEPHKESNELTSVIYSNTHFGDQTAIPGCSSFTEQHLAHENGMLHFFEPIYTYSTKRVLENTATSSWPPIPAKKVKTLLSNHINSLPINIDSSILLKNIVANSEDANKGQQDLHVELFSHTNDKYHPINSLSSESSKEISNQTHCLKSRHSKETFNLSADNFMHSIISQNLRETNGEVSVLDFPNQVVNMSKIPDLNNNSSDGNHILECGSVSSDADSATKIDFFPRNSDLSSPTFSCSGDKMQNPVNINLEKENSAGILSTNQVSKSDAIWNFNNIELPDLNEMSVTANTSLDTYQVPESGAVWNFNNITLPDLNQIPVTENSYLTDTFTQNTDKLQQTKCFSLNEEKQLFPNTSSTQIVSHDFHPGKLPYLNSIFDFKVDGEDWTPTTTIMPLDTTSDAKAVFLLSQEKLPSLANFCFNANAKAPNVCNLLLNQTPSYSPNQTHSYSPNQTPSYSYSPNQTPSYSYSPNQTPSYSYSPNQTPSHSPNQTLSYSSNQIPPYSPNQTSSYSPVQTSAYSPSQTPTYSPRQTPANLPSQIPAYSPSQTPAYSPSQTPLNSNDMCLNINSMPTHAAMTSRCTASLLKSESLSSSGMNSNVCIVEDVVNDTEALSDTTVVDLPLVVAGEIHTTCKDTKDEERHIPCDNFPNYFNLSIFNKDEFPSSSETSSAGEYDYSHVNNPLRLYQRAGSSNQAIYLSL